MTREEIQELYNIVAEKADARTRLTFDKDELQDVFIDHNDRIYLLNHLTPYTTDNVKLIKYRINDDEIDPLEGNSVMIIFNNGDAIRIDDIGVDGIVNHQFYEVRALFRRYASMIADERVLPQYRTWCDVMRQLVTCFEKADIDGFDLQQNELGYGDIFFDKGTLYISKTIETPYKLSDIKSIMYYIPRKEKEEKTWESPYVRILFSNGDELKLIDYGEFEAFIRTGKELYRLDNIRAIADLYSTIIKEKESSNP